MIRVHGVRFVVSHRASVPAPFATGAVIFTERTDLQA